MADENRWSTKGFDLAKGAVLVVVIVLLAIAVARSQSADSSQTEPPPAAAAPVQGTPQAAADGSVSLSGEAEAGSTVELWAGDTKLAEVPVDADGTWSYEGQLAPGEYEVVAKTVSAEGEVVAESEATTVTVPEEGVVAEAPAEPPAPEAAGSVSLSGEAETGSTVELWAGETKLAEVPVDADGTWSYEGQLAPGEYEVVAKTVNADGEVVAESEPVAISVSAQGEVAAAPSEPPGAEAAGTVVLSGRAEPGSTVELWAGETRLATAPVDAGGRWSYSGQLAPGEYEVVAKTVSASGEVVAEGKAMAVTVPEAGGVALSGQAEPGSTVELWAGELKLAAVPADASGTWSYSGQLAPGAYEFVAKTVNAAGEVVAESEPMPVTVAVVKAAAVTMNEPQPAADGGLMLSGTGEPGSAVEVLDNGVVVATAVVGADGTWTVNYAASTGDHAFAAQVQGQAGAGSATAQVSVTVPAPVAGRSYVVQRGDWLKKLARQFYGDQRRWIDIFEATNAKAAEDPSYHKIRDPDYIVAGWKLWIPEP